MKSEYVAIDRRGNFAVYRNIVPDANGWRWYHVCQISPFEWLLDTPYRHVVTQLWGPLPEESDNENMP